MRLIRDAKFFEPSSSTPEGGPSGWRIGWLETRFAVVFAFAFVVARENVDIGLGSKPNIPGAGRCPDCEPAILPGPPPMPPPNMFKFVITLFRGTCGIPIPPMNILFV